MTKGQPIRAAQLSKYDVGAQPATHRCPAKEDLHHGQRPSSTRGTTPAGGYKKKPGGAIVNRPPRPSTRSKPQLPTAPRGPTGLRIHSRQRSTSARKAGTQPSPAVPSSAGRATDRRLLPFPAGRCSRPAPFFVTGFRGGVVVRVDGGMGLLGEFRRGSSRREEGERKALGVVLGRRVGP